MNWNGIRGVVIEAIRAPLFEFGGKKVSVLSLIILIIILVVTVIAARGIERLTRRGLHGRGLTNEGTVNLISRLLHYAVLAGGFGVALPTVGIDLSALFAAGAVFAVGIGFAMQNIAQNFVSGVILMVERAIKPDDVLEIEGRVVRVIEMGIRSTVVRTRDDENLIVPNSILVQATVKNYTLEDNVFRLRAKVGVEYGADMALVRTTLEETANAIDIRLTDREPLVLMTEFGDNSVNWEISIWIDDPWGAGPSLSRLNEAIWWAFKDKDITIAFPQVDVHLDAPVVEGFRKLARVA